MNGVWSFTSGE